MTAEIATFIDRIAKRLEQVVGEETALLKSKTVVDLRDFNTRKSQGLYDLSRAMYRLGGQNPGPELLASLRSLHSALEANKAALSAHLLAVREIAAVISDAIREAESDGTYAPPFNQAGGTA